jgi:hypothetical protein
MVNLRSLVVPSTLALGLVAPIDSHAGSTAPDACSTGLQARAHAMGVELGEELVLRAWELVPDGCDSMELVESVIFDELQALSLPPDPSPVTTCRYIGTFDGVFAALGDQFSECIQQCFLDGSFWGELSGLIYCELAIALGGLGSVDLLARAPVEGLCGLSFEIGCELTYVATAEQYENQSGACLPYTQGDYFEVWDDSRANMCSYEFIE